MTKVLFLYPNMPPSENYSGGAGIVLQNHLELLCAAFDEVHLVQIIKGNDPDQFDLYYQKDNEALRFILSLIASRTVLRFELKIKNGARLANYWSIIRRPFRLAFPFLTSKNKNRWNKLLGEINPDIIWAEHLESAVTVQELTKRRIPVIYSHHDWEYKLRPLRNNPRQHSLRFRFVTRLIRHTEKSLVRSCSAVVTSSYTERAEIVRLGARQSLYLPLFVSAPMRTIYRSNAAEHFELFHLGGMQTTSNRVGLENFFRYCWPAIKNNIADVRLTLIGQLQGAGEFLQSCFNDAQVTRLGYVREIDEVLAPHALHIIPWNKDTGFRTKLPVAMRNSQVVAGLRAGLGGYPELINDENVLLAENYDELTEKIIAASRDPGRIRRLGDNALQTYQTFFTRDPQQEKLNRFMKLVLTNEQTPPS